jgi:hypothetical protein
MAYATVDDRGITIELKTSKAGQDEAEQIVIPKGHASGCGASLKHQATVRCVANALLERGYLASEEIDALMPVVT